MPEAGVAFRCGARDCRTIYDMDWGSLETGIEPFATSNYSSDETRP